MIAGEEAFNSRYAVCIVGAGPVGLAVALSLGRRKIRTLLIDAGPVRARRPYDNETGFSTSASRFHGSDRQTSAIGLGGTSSRWGGRCVAFDEIDFQQRDYIGNARWPIRHSEIAPYYQPALDLLRADQIDPSTIREEGLFHASPETFSANCNAADEHSRELKTSPLLTVVVNTRVKHLDFDPLSGRILGLKVKTRGSEHSVFADRFVLACGGRGNARLLLNLQAHHRLLFGAEMGDLGRFYMGHLAGEIGRIRFSTFRNSEPYLLHHGPKFGYRRKRFQPSDLLQRSASMSNIALWPQNRDLADVVKGDTTSSLALVAQSFRDPRRRDKKMLAEHLANLARHPIRTLTSSSQLLKHRYVNRRPHLQIADPENTYKLRYHAEQIPRSDNQIKLRQERDADGQLLIDVKFSYSNQDFRSVIAAHRHLDSWLRKEGLGEIILERPIEELEGLVVRQASDGFHQIGVTRMGSSRSQGVVDSNCCAFDISNLFVAGSSLFVTSGQANPTLPAVAFGLRLANHLAGQIAKV